MKLTSLSRVLLCLRGVVLCLQQKQFILVHPALAILFDLWFGGPFPLLQIHKSKVFLFLFKLLLDLDSVLVRCAKRGDVQEIHLILEVLVYEVTVLEYQMFLRISDTQLRVNGMKNISKLWHVLVHLLSQRGRIYVLSA